LRRPTVPLVLSAEERSRIEDAVRPAKAEQRLVRRAQALLMMTEAVPATDIARLVGVHVRTVEAWRKRFDCDNPSASWRTLQDRAGRLSLSASDAARVEAEACRLPSDVGLPVTHCISRNYPWRAAERDHLPQLQPTSSSVRPGGPGSGQRGIG
jgi:hypothetical protein